MSAEQLAFLAARKKQTAGSDGTAQTASTKPATPTTSRSETSLSSIPADGFEPGLGLVERAWTYLSGGGGLGSYTVLFHKTTGASVELWHDSTGGLTFQRALDANVKYCSALGSMQDEEGSFAPVLLNRLRQGEGKPVEAHVNAGSWGNLKKEAGKQDGRLWWSVKVNGREGMDTMEIALIADGFVFQTTGGFKDVAVYKGELMQLERKQTQSLLQTPAEFVSINR